MIIRNDHEGWLQCVHCSEFCELSRRSRSCPETLLLLQEEMKRDHKDCAAYAHDPRMAQKQRRLKLAFRAELVKTQRRRVA